MIIFRITEGGGDTLDNRWERIIVWTTLGRSWSTCALGVQMDEQQEGEKMYSKEVKTRERGKVELVRNREMALLC